MAGLLSRSRSVRRSPDHQTTRHPGPERAIAPIPYVRSFYFLGKIHENRGEMEKAREYYQRFYEYWKDGDFDRERVEEARSKMD